MEKMIKEPRPNGRFIYHFVDVLPKGQVGFMKVEDLENAKMNRRRQNPTYPDGTELTDESKRELRRNKKKSRIKISMVIPEVL